MITKMCLGRCGRRVARDATNGRCDVCNRSYRPGGHWSKGRDRAAQGRFRDALVLRAGGRCEFVMNGVRCPETTDLEAHHLEPGCDDPDTGALLCRPHHKAVDDHAR